MTERYRLPVGFSDHTDGISAASHAVSAGAVMIEKHFTLDDSRSGYDHRLSLEPDSFATMVKNIRTAETMMGKAGKQLGEEELTKADELHRVLVAREEIVEGEEFSVANVGIKRPLPGKLGLKPKFFDQLLGRKATRNLAPDEPITAESAGAPLL